MSDKTIFGCAETGTYQTSAPNPHIELSGTASTAYSIVQLFADAMSTDEMATVSVVKDKDNWAVYGGAKFSNSTPDTLDLSVATLLESKGTLSDQDSVTCLGLAPANRGISVARVYRSTALNSPSNVVAKLTFDTVSYDVDGVWDSGNAYFVPKKPGYYWFNAGFTLQQQTTCALYAYKNTEMVSHIGGGDGGTMVSYGKQGGCIIYCNGTTDYVYASVYTAAPKAYAVINSAATFMEIIGPLAV